MSPTVASDLEKLFIITSGALLSKINALASLLNEAQRESYLEYIKAEKEKFIGLHGKNFVGCEKIIDASFNVPRNH